MKHKAKRPFKLDFSSQWETHKELFTLELDANDIYEWKVGDSVPEIGASIFQLEFYGLDFAKGGKSLLGTVLFDSCDWGLEIHEVVSDAWYEARHPWLDYEDALRKGVFDEKKIHDIEYLTLVEDVDYKTKKQLNVFTKWLHFGDYLQDDMTYAGFRAIKPLKPFEYAHFDKVEVWHA